MKQILDQSKKELDRAEQLFLDGRMSETDFQLMLKVSRLEHQIFNSIAHIGGIKARVSSTYGATEAKAVFEKTNQKNIDDTGSIDRLLIKLHEAKRQYRYGKISKADFIKKRKEVYNERLKIHSRIKSIQKEIDSVLLGKNGTHKALKILEKANLYTNFNIDPRDICISCEEHLIYVLPEDCIEYSQDKSKSTKCENCEHLETVKKLLGEPMTKERKKADIQVVNEKLIDEAVQFINEKANKTLYKGSIEIGGYILENFFEGDPKLASSRNPKKQQSFNKLCERDDLIVHPNQLGLMVRVASQEQYFIDKKIDIKALSYTHKASFVKMDNGVKKSNMVKKCIKEEWSTRQLEDTIKKYLKTIPSSSKPSLIRTTKKYITKIDDVLKTVEDKELDFGTDEISKMTDKRRDALKTYLSDLEAKAKEGMDRSKTISERCSSALKELAKIETEKKKNPVKRGRPAKEK